VNVNFKPGGDAMSKTIEIHVSRVGEGCKIDDIPQDPAQAGKDEQVQWKIVGDPGHTKVKIHFIGKSPFPRADFELPAAAGGTAGDFVKHDAPKERYQYQTTPAWKHHYAEVQPSSRQDVDPEVQVGGN
jgi:hypothetical protein